MSKTSARKAAKKGNRERRGMFPTHSVVGYEEHARLKLELERVSAVLGDLIEESKGAAVPAREVVAWVRNPEAVSYLLAQDSTDRNGECSGGAGEPDQYCGGDAHYPHRATCKVMAAWRKLGDPRALLDIENCHEAALEVEHQRKNPPIQPPPGARIAVVSSPYVREGDAYLIQESEFTRGPRAENFFGIDPASYDLWRGTTDLWRGTTRPLSESDIVDAMRRLALPAGGNWSREYLGEFPSTPQADPEPEGE